MVNGNNGKPLLVLVPGVGFVGFSLLSLGFDPRADVAKELTTQQAPAAMSPLETPDF